MSTVPPPRRRRLPIWLLAVAFVLVPLVEIYVIIRIGQVIGALWTIALLIADSLLGSWLVKREGRRAWQALSVALQEHRMPARELADGVLILVGGLLMLTPGFVLDIVGALCILPFTRPVGRRVLTRMIGSRLAAATTPVGAGFPGFGTGFGTGSGTGTQRRPGPDVVQGDVVPENPGD